MISVWRFGARRTGAWAPFALSIAATVGIATIAIDAAAHKGHLVLLGGGPTPAAVFTRALNLAGGRAAIVAVLPQTYPNDSIGDAAVELWKDTGAREAFKVALDDVDRARAALDHATLIWMPGGFAWRLMDTLAGTPIPDVIRRRFAEGATIGGTSAGAMVMSATMIAGQSPPEDASASGSRTMEGLGLWPAAIVSPHFTERRQSGPLRGVLRNHPGLIGVGIDEGTAIFISNNRLEVAGSGTITIIDAASAPTRIVRSGGRLALSDDGFPLR